MNKNNGYTILELVVGITIFLTIVGAFFYIIQGTFLFVDARKQEVSVLDNANQIKEHILQVLSQGDIQIVLPRSQTDSGIVSQKDPFPQNGNISPNYDTLVLGYEKKTLSGSTILTQTGMYVLGVVDKETYKLFSPLSDNHGFFGLTQIGSGDTLYNKVFSDYVNNQVNITRFEYSLTNIDGAKFLRIDIGYDNDLDDTYWNAKNIDQYYFSGSTFLLKKLDL